MDIVDNFFAEQGEKNSKGTLTVGEAVFGYYRLLEGEEAGKVIIKTNAKIDDEPIIFYANGLTWQFESKLKNIRCERTVPTFPNGQHPIDCSKAYWYNDGSDKIQHHQW